MKKYTYFIYLYFLSIKYIILIDILYLNFFYYQKQQQQKKKKKKKKKKN